MYVAQYLDMRDNSLRQSFSKIFANPTLHLLEIGQGTLSRYILVIHPSQRPV
jgi:hypothetical protein